MILPKQTTNIELKQKEFPAFMQLIRDQLAYGGNKYAMSEAKEATDHIMEVFGVDWTLGTMEKYILRFKNKGREKDLLKICAYSFIVWLAMGFNKEHDHDTDTWNEEGEENVGSTKE